MVFEVYPSCKPRDDVLRVVFEVYVNDVLRVVFEVYVNDVLRVVFEVYVNDVLRVATRQHCRGNTFLKIHNLYF